MEENKIGQFWRPATADDVARVMDGKTVEARFRDTTGLSWKHGSLSGWSKIDKSDSLQWASSEGAFWRFCQVYDPPEWYINKPDPGEGYRLLEKFPHELVQNGDDVHRDGYWHESAYAKRGDSQQFEKLWYRRRIANNPEIPDSCNSSETPNSSRSSDVIPSGFRVLGKDEERLASDAYWSLGCKEWIVLGDDRVKYANEKTGKWHAIRRMEHEVGYDLVDGYIYYLPNGSKIRVTAKGFEVL
jgi:hypothetical protein